MKYHPSYTHNDSVAFRRRQQQRMRQCEKIRNINATISTLTDMEILAREAQRLCGQVIVSGPTDSEVLQSSVFG